MKRALAVVAAWIVSGLSLGDVVHLKDGRRIEGKVTKADGAVIVETSFGVMKLSTAEVERIEASMTPEEQFRERFAPLCDAKDVAGLEALAKWCSSKALTKQRRTVLDTMKEFDPGNEFANTSLGLVRHGERFVTREEKQRLETEAHDAAMLAKGLVRYDGAWVTPKEKAAREKGFVLHEGEWMPEAQARRAQGFLFDGEEWRRVEDFEIESHRKTLKEMGRDGVLRSGAQTHLVTDLTDDAADRLFETLEATSVEIMRRFDAPTPLPPTWRGIRPKWSRCVALVLSSPELYADYADHLVSAGYLTMSGGADAKRGAYSNCMWPPIVYLYMHANGLQHLRANLIDPYLSFALEWRLGQPAPPWLYLGLSYAMQIDIVGTMETIPPGVAFELHELRVDRLAAVARKGKERGALPDLAGLVARDFSRFTISDVAQAVVLVRVLDRRSPNAMGRLCETLRRRSYHPDLEESARLKVSRDSLEQVLETSFDQLAAEWTSLVEESASAGIERDATDG